MSGDAKNRKRSLFDWDVLDVLLGERTAIDLPRLRTDTDEKARSFLRAYGYDPGRESDREEIHNLKNQAIGFIERNLLQNPDRPEESMEIPPAVRESEDPAQLLIWASGERGELQNWSCSVLRVMHTMTHVTNDLDLHFFPHIQNQILNVVLRWVYTDPTGDLYLGEDETGIRLYILDIKSQKSHESTALKLLHKREHIGADIFDRLGFRFVTFTKAEALMALNFFHEKFAIAFANVKSTRSRNTLIDVARFRELGEPWFEKFDDGDIDEAELMQQLDRISSDDSCQSHTPEDIIRERNLYSSTSYHSIQFTVRQLVRVRSAPVNRMMARKSNKNLIEYRFFFPFEVQILDKASYIESRRGRASHAEYKRSQIRAVRKRIFPWLESDDTGD